MITSQPAIYFLAVLLLAAIVVFWLDWQIDKQSAFKVCFLDVGQGDSIFIQAPSGQQVLIDGGPSNKALAELNKLMPFNDRDLDLIVATHYDSDHIKGLLHVLQNYRVDKILETGAACETDLCQAWQEASLAEQAQIIYAQTGQRFVLGPNIILDVLYPLAALKDSGQKNSNNNSIIIKLTAAAQKILFTGDLESAGEKALIQAGLNLQANVLKVGHHGSKSATTEEFLQAVSASLAIISAGKDNQYGHPTDEVLQKLQGLDIWRTDEKGTICCQIKEQKLECN